MTDKEIEKIIKEYLIKNCSQIGNFRLDVNSIEVITIKNGFNHKI